MENSEGVRIEYIALFLAILLPGALVAISHELLQNIPRFAEIRIYCAGVWHNAVVSRGIFMFSVVWQIYALALHVMVP